MPAVTVDTNGSQISYAAFSGDTLDILAPCWINRINYELVNHIRNYLPCEIKPKDEFEIGRTGAVQNEAFSIAAMLMKFVFTSVLLLDHT